MAKVKQKYNKGQTNLVKDWGFPKVPTTLKIGKKKGEE
jgi:hypothetical protein